MRTNEQDALTGRRVRLVPYRAAHVPQYHAWMEDALLREQTGSEPLTLEEEFDMQQRWQADPDKLCFILLDTCEPGAPMAGDVNMFLLDDDQLGPGWGEVEVMVARPESRRKGLATEALQLFLAYAVAKSIVAIGFVAKIKEWNTPSLAMFRKLGFTESQRVAAFREVHLILEPASAPDAWADLARRARDLTIDVAPAEADLAEHQAVR